MPASPKLRVQIVLIALAWCLVAGALPLALLGGLSLVGIDAPALVDFDFLPAVFLIALLMLGTALVGRLPRKSLAVWGPALILGIGASEYVLAAAGCQVATGIHPVNALGLLGVALGIARTFSPWSNAKESLQ